MTSRSAETERSTSLTPAAGAAIGSVAGRPSRWPKPSSWVVRTGSPGIASRADSSLHVFTVAGGRPWLRLRGAPADIGVDVRRRVVAVPYVDRDTVELFRFP